MPLLFYCEALFGWPCFFMSRTFGTVDLQHALIILLRGVVWMAMFFYEPHFWHRRKSTVPLGCPYKTLTPDKLLLTA
ncbi:hypothetical protein QBC46DRAFT_8124 [Diplogelasinospora grovesii]|uniref:Uncharacterized protein n=1 Tax=Diplogelasinospora grovesii TaxID=303347 RepID=A0AAN6S7P7_9PEZI|nr:hypothetical protein QBC46DRAFT_8124 [Diplogelasinospora grovesii]